MIGLNDFAIGCTLPSVASCKTLQKPFRNVRIRMKWDKGEKRWQYRLTCVLPYLVSLYMSSIREFHTKSANSWFSHQIHTHIHIYLYMYAQICIYTHIYIYIYTHNINSFCRSCQGQGAQYCPVPTWWRTWCWGLGWTPQTCCHVCAKKKGVRPCFPLSSRNQVGLKTMIFHSYVFFLPIVNNAIFHSYR